jgi:hypothetical protein
VNLIGAPAFFTYVGRVSQPSRRRAAFGAAVLGVLLALASSLGIAAPARAAAPDIATSTSSSASFNAASGTLDNAAVRTSHSSALGSTASHRTYGGVGSAPAAISAIALLLLAGLSLLVGVRRIPDATSWRSPGAAGPRAPPVFC